MTAKRPGGERAIALPTRWLDPESLPDVVAAFAVEQRPRVWLVGGAVRDRLLGRPIHDLDLLVEEEAVPLARAIADRFGGAFCLLDAGRDYGRALLSTVDGAFLTVDVARLRGESLEADLRARDFTVNAMAVPLTAAGDGPLIDPTGGWEDLRAGWLRLTSPQALHADPVRLLRAPRLAGELSLRLTPETIQAIRAAAMLLVLASPERVRDELWRMVGVPGCARAARLLHALDLLPHVLPELSALAGVTQSEPHHADVFEHTLQAMHAIDRFLQVVLGQDPPRDVVEGLMWDALHPYADPLRAHLGQALSAGRAREGWLRWLALTHDWGKATTRAVDADGRVRFIGHERVSAELIEMRLDWLRFSRIEIRHLSEMARHHMRSFALTLGDAEPSARAVYRFFRDAADAGPDLLLFGLADQRATYGPRLALDAWRAQCARTARLLNEWCERRDARITPAPLLNGRQLMAELGIPPGPTVGRLLEAVREAQAAGEVHDRDQALDLARLLLHELL
jgi:poly(A) polymerase